MTTHGFNTLDPLNDYPSVNSTLWRLWDCGVAWSNLNPSKGIFDYSRLDQLLALAESYKTTVSLVLAGTPQWASSNPSGTTAAPWVGLASNTVPRDLADWDAYVLSVVTRYKGRIKSYQVWNEPQLKQFWDDYTKVSTLGVMTKRAYDIIKKIDPKALVIAAPVLPRPGSGGMAKAVKYLNSLKLNRWPVDVYAAHIYPEIGKDYTRWDYLVSDWKVTLANLKVPAKPLWITETNYNLFGGPLPDNTVTTYVNKTHQLAVKAGISQIYWYAWGVHSDPKLEGIRFVADSAGTKAVERLL